MKTIARFWPVLILAAFIVILEHMNKHVEEYHYRYLSAVARADSLVAVNDSLYRKVAIPLIGENDSLKTRAAWLEDAIRVKDGQIQSLTETTIHYKLLYLKGKAMLDSVSSTTNIRYYYFKKMMGLTTVTGHFTSEGDYDIGISHKPLIIKHAYVKTDSGLYVYTTINDSTMKVVQMNNFYHYQPQGVATYKTRYGYMGGILLSPISPAVYAGIYMQRKGRFYMVGLGSNGSILLQYMKGF